MVDADGVDCARDAGGERRQIGEDAGGRPDADDAAGAGDDACVIRRDLPAEGHRLIDEGGVGEHQRLGRHGSGALD